MNKLYHALTFDNVARYAIATKIRDGFLFFQTCGDAKIKKILFQLVKHNLVLVIPVKNVAPHFARTAQFLRPVFHRASALVTM